MKHLTIKKVALGLVLAGYVASSAFALTSTTNMTIQGRAPFVNAPSLNPTVDDYTKSRVDISVARANGTALASGDKWKTGDIISLKYRTVDADGDNEGTTFLTGKTVIFSYFIPTTPGGTTGTWTSSTASDITVTSGVVKWKIPSGALKAEKISFAIRPTTEFGDPDKNSWAKGLINNAADPADGGDQTNPTPVTPTDPDGPGGDKADGSGPIEPGDNYTIAIYEATVSGATVTPDLTKEVSGSSTINPTIGKTYAVKIMDTSGTTPVDATANFTYAWTLTGSATWGALAPIPAVSTTQLTAVSGTTIVGVAHKLDVNSAYDASYKAGAQKYNLTVTTL